jgi:LAGLIDADG DNA endonuclease family
MRGSLTCLFLLLIIVDIWVTTFNCYSIYTTLAVITPTAFQKEAITGLLLSDGLLRNSSGSNKPTVNYRLEFTFKAATLAFILWLKFTILGTLCTTGLPTPWPKENPVHYWFCTRALPYFTEIYSS